ncbi:hypothetical protein [Yinghuangia seranimata]|uniref:hypothetical protein n=1 Tax=Yinghuangia seranimata TaxID=408067 RepID=UPI00248B8535|nr:hypothetical protein [Yinghuangia seranimata]MDI2131043.1 hypothetical protein [Yinghuangia seranimata]
MPDPPQRQVPDEMVLSAYVPGGGKEFAPTDWFVPAYIDDTRPVAAGPDARVFLTGWQVWPYSVTLRLAVFLRRVRTSRLFDHVGPDSADGLRCGLRLSDGRRVTTLDGEQRGEADPLTLTLSPHTGGAHHYDVDLHLSQLPTAGPLTLVVAWPAEGVPETAVELDATAVRDAAARAVEVWPGLPRTD